MNSLQVIAALMVAATASAFVPAAVHRRASIRMTAEPAMEKLRFLTPAQALEVRKLAGTPAYVYDMASLERNANAAVNFPNAFGVTARFAMKACPNAAILQYLSAKGMHFDCSSVYEIRRAMGAGIEAGKLSLSTQELGEGFAELVKGGAEMNACSVSQLKAFGEAFKGTGQGVGLRFNPGLGSGGTGKTNVGGPSSSFGIWHEQWEECAALAEEYGITVKRIHTHIGSGSDPAVWQRVASMSLDLCRKFPDVVALNLGGGYKVARMLDEKGTDLEVVGAPVKDAFVAFEEETGRALKLEIEPGTFMVANAGSLVTTIQDKVVTGTSEGHVFLKLDAGMTEVLRPSLYGAQHPLVVVKQDGSGATGSSREPVVVVGHCCESGDLLSCGPGDPEAIAERLLPAVEVGDLLVVEGSGAYCSAMSTKNYNSFPEAPELMLDLKGELHVVRKRQALEQIYENEVALPASAF